MPINEISWNTESEGAADLAGNPALADFKDVNGLAKAFVDTKALVGQSIRIPSAEAGAEDMTAFYTSMQEKVPGLMLKPDLLDEVNMASVMTSIGKPEAAEAYEMPTIEGMEFSDEKTAFLKATAFEANFTGKQFTKWVTDTAKAELASNTTASETTQQELNGLKQEWGTAFEGKYAKAVQIAEATNAPPAVVKALKERVAGVETIKWFDGLVGVLGSEDFQLATLPPGSGGITPTEAKERASEIRTKISGMSEGHPEYQNLINKMMEFDKLGRAS